MITSTFAPASLMRIALPAVPSIFSRPVPFVILESVPSCCSTKSLPAPMLIASLSAIDSVPPIVASVPLNVIAVLELEPDLITSSPLEFVNLPNSVPPSCS